MKDLYRALGLHGSVADRTAIERALAQGKLDPEVRQAAGFVLLDPARKARYDWVLGRAQELSEIRTRLALPVDTALVAHPGTPGHTTRGPMELPPNPLPHYAWAGWIAAAVPLLVIAIGWAGFRFNRPPNERRPKAVIDPASSTSQGNRPSEDPLAAVRAGEPGAVPPPDHGWLQMNSEIQPAKPWEIDTDPGQDYLLTLLDSKSQATVLTLYLRGGEPYQGQVPIGVFELAYTTGTQWFGPQLGFGSSAKRIQPALTYRVVAEAGDVGTWHLKLHPTSCEGVPIPPPAPVTSDPPPAPEIPGNSL